MSINAISGVGNGYDGYSWALTNRVSPATTEPVTPIQPVTPVESDTGTSQYAASMSRDQITLSRKAQEYLAGRRVQSSEGDSIAGQMAKAGVQADTAAKSSMIPQDSVELSAEAVAAQSGGGQQTASALGAMAPSGDAPQAPAAPAAGQDESPDLSTLSEYEIRKLLTNGDITYAEAQAELQSRETSSTSTSQPSPVARAYLGATRTGTLPSGMFLNEVA